MEQFRLLKLITRDNNEREIDINFSEFNTSESIYTTLMIGINGAGKSYALSIISNIFRYLESIKNGGKLKIDTKNFLLEYALEGDYYKIDYIAKKRIYKNNKPIGLDKLRLPKKVLCTSFSVNDKFTFSENISDSIYNYLGIRGSESGTGTKTHQKKIGDAIINLSKHNLKSRSVVKVLKFLGYAPTVELRFKLRQINYFFKDEISFEKFDSYFSNWRKRSKRRTEPFYYKQYVDLKDKDELYDVYKLVRKIPNMKTINNYISLVYDFSNTATMKNDNNYSVMKKMMLLDLISTPDIVIRKGTEFSIDNASSGEFHFIFNMLNVLSSIDDKSLVLIDEPEISLHPEWQCRYISILTDVLRDYKTSHIIVASHSHFMASELNPRSSCITRVMNDGKKINGDLYNSHTFGWSVENILYNVFNIKTLRNYYLEKDISSVLSLIEDTEKNKSKIESLLTKMKMLHLTTEDPLNDLISKIERSLQ